MEEAIALLEHAVLQAPVRVFRLDGALTGALEPRDVADGVAMHELRAKLDGRRDAGFVSRPNAAADAVARFQDENTTTAGRERRSRGEPGRTGTNHENVMRHDQYTFGSSGGLYAV